MMKTQHALLGIRAQRTKFLMAHGRAIHTGAPSLATVASLAILAACQPAGLAGSDVDDPRDDSGVTLPADACAVSPDDFGLAPERFRFEAQEPALQVHFVREWAGQGAGHSSIYALQHFAIERDGACASTDDAGELDYQNSHHNWYDVANAVLDGTRYAVTMEYVLDFDSPVRWEVTLTGTDVDSGAVVLEPIALTPTGGPFTCWSCPTFLPVAISEVLPDNDGVSLDEAGEAEPWVELWNMSGDAVDIGGWQLLAGGAASGAWTIPAGTTIDRHQMLIVWLDGETSEGPLHASFAFPKSGGELTLRNAHGVSHGERLFTSSAPGQSLDYSFTEEGYVSATPTPGEKSPHQQ